jgi:hypothetical protein
MKRANMGSALSIDKIRQLKLEVAQNHNSAGTNSSSLGMGEIPKINNFKLSMNNPLASDGAFTDHN